MRRFVHTCVLTVACCLGVFGTIFAQPWQGESSTEETVPVAEYGSQQSNLGLTDFMATVTLKVNDSWMGPAAGIPPLRLPSNGLLRVKCPDPECGAAEAAALAETGSVSAVVHAWLDDTSSRDCSSKAISISDWLGTLEPSSGNSRMLMWCTEGEGELGPTSDHLNLFLVAMNGELKFSPLQPPPLGECEFCWTRNVSSPAALEVKLDLMAVARGHSKGDYHSIRAWIKEIGGKECGKISALSACNADILLCHEDGKGARIKVTRSDAKSGYIAGCYYEPGLNSFERVDSHTYRWINMEGEWVGDEIKPKANGNRDIYTYDCSKSDSEKPLEKRRYTSEAEFKQNRDPITGEPTGGQSWEGVPADRSEALKNVTLQTDNRERYEVSDGNSGGIAAASDSSEKRCAPSASLSCNRHSETKWYYALIVNRWLAPLVAVGNQIVFEGSGINGGSVEGNAASAAYGGWFVKESNPGRVVFESSSSAELSETLKGFVISGKPGTENGKVKYSITGPWIGSFDEVSGPDFLPEVSIVASKPSGAEAGSKTAVFTVKRMGARSNPLTVYHGIGGTARNGKDYAKLPGSVTVPAGKSFAKIIIKPIDDSAEEKAETVVLTLRQADPWGSPYKIGSPPKATVKIVDDDEPR